MDFENFKEFMLQSAAQHDARIAEIEESLKSLTRTFNESIAGLANATAILVDNQVHLQEKVDRVTKNVDRLTAISERQHLRIERMDDAFDKRMTRISERLDKLSEIVFRHVTDSNEHGSQPN